MNVAMWTVSICGLPRPLRPWISTSPKSRNPYLDPLLPPLLHLFRHVEEDMPLPERR